MRIIQLVEIEKRGKGLGCYCEKAENVVLSDIQNGTVPDEALVNKHCWQWICTVRADWLSSVNEETWRELCAKRGYLRARQNPRGF